MRAFFNHLNPAVLRNIMLKMNQEELSECINFIQKQALKLPAGTKRDMYVNLFVWSSKVYSEKYTTKKPPLF
ncbi:MAG: hypothetical protein ACNS60_21035 [Candidatus Cyclobacteriaceae bacterium M2_1C_046]